MKIKKSLGLIFLCAVIVFTYVVPVSAGSMDVINVKDCGAVGDGTTDDTAAFQTAITQSTSQKKPIYVPYGTYKITQALTLADQLIFG